MTNSNATPSLDSVTITITAEDKAILVDILNFKMDVLDDLINGLKHSTAEGDKIDLAEYTKTIECAERVRNLLVSAAG